MEATKGRNPASLHVNDNTRVNCLNPSMYISFLKSYRIVCRNVITNDIFVFSLSFSD